jgi:hypothetical protein
MLWSILSKYLTSYINYTNITTIHYCRWNCCYCNFSICAWT